MSTYNPVTPDIIEKFKAVVGDQYVYTDDSKKEPYSHDELADAHYIKMPEAVVLPANTDEVAAIVKICSDHNIPVCARGGGSAFTSASVALFGGIVLSIERMNKILEIDKDNMFMVVEPGARTVEVQEAANREGYLYAGDPCSGESCFIGGNVATNAGGNKAVKYGTTRAQVNGVELVTAEGEVVTIGGKCRKDSSGYSLVNLVVGSEGTIGIVTKIYLKLVPLAENVLDILAVFEDLPTAIGLVPKVMAAGITPMCVEFMDNESINECEKYVGETLPGGDKRFYIIISVEGNNEDVLDEQIVKIDELANEQGATEVLAADPERIWKARKAYAEADRARSVIASMEDLVVPMALIPETIERISALSKKYDIAIHCAGHAGDGNIHCNILKDQLSEAEWEDKLPKLQKEIYEFVYSVGGKLSGEHGIGFKRAKLLEEYTNPVEIKMMKAIKKALDPKNILNPGKVISVD